LTLCWLRLILEQADISGPREYLLRESYNSALVSTLSKTFQKLNIYLRFLLQMSLAPCGCNFSPALVEQGPGSTDHRVYQEHGIFQRVAVEFLAGACKLNLSSDGV